MARKKLFSHYNEVKCTNQQKPILEIQRKSTRAYVKDIVDQMVKVDKKVEVNMFCLPWDYVLKPLASDSELITQEMEKQVSEEIDMKINKLEQRLNEKHRILHDSILASVNKALKENKNSRPSYANVAAVHSQGQQHGGQGHGQSQQQQLQHVQATGQGITFAVPLPPPQDRGIK